jgi:hypothetical protein
MRFVVFSGIFRPCSEQIVGAGRFDDPLVSVVKGVITNIALL